MKILQYLLSFVLVWFILKLDREEFEVFVDDDFDLWVLVSRFIISPLKMPCIIAQLTEPMSLSLRLELKPAARFELA